MSYAVSYQIVAVEELDEASIARDADAVGLADGGVAVAGLSGGKVVVRRFDADGDLVAETLTGVTAEDVALSALSDGKLVLAVDGGAQLFWYTVGPTGVLQGAAADTPFNLLLDAEAVGGLGGGRFAVAAQSFKGGTDNDIRVSIRSNDGSLVTTFAVDASTANDQNPSMAALNDGGLVVVWHRNAGSTNSLWYAIYDADGAVRTGPTLYDSTGGFNRNASVVALQNGGFAIAYEDSGWAGGDGEITLARFNAQGGDSVAVNISDDTFENIAPSLTVLSNGMLMLGYSAYTGATYDVTWRLIDARTFERLAVSYAGESAANDVATTVAAQGVGRVATFFNQGSDVYGQTLQSRRFWTGDAAGDVYTGDDLSDWMDAGGGADIMEGGGGADVLGGGEGNDVFRFFAGDVARDETINGDAGVDRLQVLESVDFTLAAINGVEELEFVGGPVPTTARFRADQIVNGYLSADLRVDGFTASNPDTLRIDMLGRTALSLAGFTFVDWNSAGTENDRVLVFGDADAETITGSSQRDDIDGGAGNDALSGGGGDDVLKGGLGRDALNGGAGAADVADYREKTKAVVVALNGANPVTVTVGGLAEDAIRAVEQVLGGEAADVLTGDAAGNLLNGYFGNDILRGGGGKDALFGSGGIDTADYRDKAAAVAVTLTGGALSNVTVGGVQEDVISNIEVVYGGAAADTLTGDGFGNLFRGGGGADVIDGAAGRDAIDFRDKTAGVVLVLTGATQATATVGGAAEDRVRNVEDVYGGTANDILVGDAAINQLFGNGGNDTLRGGVGADLLTGGAGADTFVYNSVAESAGTARDTIADFATGADKIRLTLIDANAGVAGDQAFIFGGAFTAGHLRVTTLSPGKLLVEGNTDADSAAEFALVVTTPTPLAATDFLL